MKANECNAIQKEKRLHLWSWAKFSRNHSKQPVSIVTDYSDLWHITKTLITWPFQMWTHPPARILQNQGFLPVALATPVPGNPTVHKESVQFTWGTWHLQFFKMNSETTSEIHTYYALPAKNQACLPKASPWDFLLIFFGGSVKRTEEIKASTSLQPQISCGFVTATFGSPHLCEKSWSVQNYTFLFICTYNYIISSMKPKFRRWVKEGVLDRTSTTPRPDFGQPSKTNKSGLTNKQRVKFPPSFTNKRHDSTINLNRTIPSVLLQWH